MRTHPLIISWRPTCCWHKPINVIIPACYGQESSVVCFQTCFLPRLCSGILRTDNAFCHQLRQGDSSVSHASFLQLGSRRQSTREWKKAWWLSNCGDGKFMDCVEGKIARLCLVADGGLSKNSCRRVGLSVHLHLVLLFAFGLVHRFTLVIYSCLCYVGFM